MALQSGRQWHTADLRRIAARQRSDGSLPSRSDSIDDRYLLLVLVTTQRHDLSSGRSQTATTQLRATRSTGIPPSRPVDEQRRIADFLDDQITRIDQIIAAAAAADQAAD